MMERTRKKLDELVDALKKDVHGTFVEDDKKHHRIETSGGHIKITGDFKSLTVNGKVVKL